MTPELPPPPTLNIKGADYVKRDIANRVGWSMHTQGLIIGWALGSCLTGLSVHLGAYVWWMPFAVVVLALLMLERSKP